SWSNRATRQASSRRVISSSSVGYPLKNRHEKLLTSRGASDSIQAHAWGRGVAVNTSACQAEDRGFDPRRSRPQVKYQVTQKTSRMREVFLFFRAEESDLPCLCRSMGNKFGL